MPSFKSDSSFFHKIALGAIGSRAVTADLVGRGHTIVELERGALDAKIWKGIKRKRVRIPDLICISCGQRVEVRTKSKPELSMSHSPTIPERRWDFGMVGSDLISTPICTETDSEAMQIITQWTRGELASDTAYWSERERVKWQLDGAINYLTVQAFRDARPDKTQTKGAEEGSETTLIWRSCFSPCNGTVVAISDANITVQNMTGTRVRRGCKGIQPIVSVGDEVRRNQILACNVTPQGFGSLQCKAGLAADEMGGMLASQHLPVRFAGIKLARIRRVTALQHEISRIANDADEDIYVRLEAKAYMAQVHNVPIGTLFGAELAALDKPDQLEAIITIGEIGTESAAELLATVLADPDKGYFLRSAAAYCLGRIDCAVARSALVQAFSTQSHRVREDALAALAGMGSGAIGELFSGISHSDEQIQAGCAEAIRWQALRSEPASLEQEIVRPLAQVLANDNRSLLAVWLGGQLPETLVQAALAKVMNRDSRLAYALAVAWAYARSWIAPLNDSLMVPKQ